MRIKKIHVQAVILIALLLVLIEVIAGAIISDMAISFRLSGQVNDAATGEPIDGAELYFVGYKLDDWRPDGGADTIGKCAPDGGIRMAVSHVFGQSGSILQRIFRKQGRFGIRIKKEGYAPYEQEFLVEDVSISQQVDLGLIELEPVTAETN